MLEGLFEAWYAETRSANWREPADIKALYAHASILKNSRVIFNIRGNKYRLIARLAYQHSIVSIRFIGTHREYDRINAGEI